MATNFPTGLDALTNPTSTDTLNSPSHAGQHTDANDAIEALQAKVGVNGSAVTTSLDYKVEKLTGGTTGQVLKKLSNTNFDVQWQTDISGRYYVGDTAPSSPTAGDVWFESDTGRTFVYYDSFWVEFGANAGIPLPGSNGDVLVSDSGSTSGLRWQGQEVAGRNKIINGNMMVAQRGTSFVSTGGANNDDAYTLDRWYILSDGNDAIDVTQSTDAPTGGLNSIALDVETINKKFGIAQIIEQKNCIGLIGETVTLSFRARVSSTTKLDNVKAAIVAWSGTADTVTSDIISAWGVEGTNPTLIANATYENTPANLGVTTSWARYSITAAVDTASTKNIIVFIWSDVTDTTLGDFLYVTDVQLEYGSVATRFTMHGGGFQAESAACQRYYYRLETGSSARLGSGYNTSTAGQVSVIGFPTEMRVSPTALETSGTAADYQIQHGNFSVTVCNVVPTFLTGTKSSAGISNTVASGLTAGQGSLFLSVTSAAYLAWSAEL